MTREERFAHLEDSEISHHTQVVQTRFVSALFEGRTQDLDIGIKPEDPAFGKTFLNAFSWLLKLQIQKMEKELLPQGQGLSEGEVPR